MYIANVQYTLFTYALFLIAELAVLEYYQQSVLTTRPDFQGQEAANPFPYRPQGTLYT